MRPIILSLLLLLVWNTGVNAQFPGWGWAKSAGSTGNDEAMGLCSDAANNIYLAGYFTSPELSFGNIILSHTGADGTADVFLAKFDALGNIIWAHSGTGDLHEMTTFAHCDAAGNVYVSGLFYSPTLTFGTYTLTNAGTNSCDFFLIKLDSQGNILWLKGAGGNMDDWCRGISTDAACNVYISGEFTSPTITFDGITLVHTGNATTSDLFIVKFDSSGNTIWANSAGYTYGDFGMSLCAQPNGDVYLTGGFTGGPVSFDTITLNNMGGLDLYLVKYDSQGNVLWAKSAGTEYMEYGSTISVDGSGNAYVAGIFYGPTYTIGNTTLTNAGDPSKSDIFLAKYDNQGNVLWAKSIGGTDDEYTYHLKANAGGDFWLTATSYSDSMPIGNSFLINAGGGDAFVAKYDTDGNLDWATSIGSDDVDVARGISIGGNIYVTGIFKSSSLPIGTTTLINAGGSDIYLANITTSIGIEGPNSVRNGISIYPNPSAGTINISSRDEISEVRVYNSQGQLIHQLLSSGHKCTLYLSQPGIYFVCCEINGEMHSQKVCIVKEI